jgi:hypothetical protein
MAEPENHTLRLLRDIRAVIESMNANLDRRFDEQDKKNEQNYQDLRERIERIRHAPFGESVLGRHVAADVEERLIAIEKRLSLLDQRVEDLAHR